MMDENKVKFEILKQQMYSLNNNITNLKNINSKLISDLKKTIILNDQIIGDEELQNISNDYEKIKNIIFTNIISKI